MLGPPHSKLEPVNQGGTTTCRYVSPYLIVSKWTAHEYLSFQLLLCRAHERIRLVNIVLPLPALWLAECHSVAQIQGQGKLPAVQPFPPRVGSRVRGAVAGIYESRSLSFKTPST